MKSLLPEICVTDPKLATFHGNIFQERLDYEIHVLRKHEEEIVLVKSEQKRKITILQDTINKLRQRVSSTNSKISKEELRLHEMITNIRQQLDNLLVKKAAYGASAAKKRDQIAEMSREEIREKVGMVASADFLLQQRYVSMKPRKIDIYNDDDYRTGFNLSLSSRRDLKSTARSAHNAPSG